VLVLFGVHIVWLRIYMLDSLIVIKDRRKPPEYAAIIMYEFASSSCQKCCAGNTTKRVVVEMHRAPQEAQQEPIPIQLGPWRWLHADDN
jgi:hypothetical protein